MPPATAPTASDDRALRDVALGVAGALIAALSLAAALRPAPARVQIGRAHV